MIPNFLIPFVENHTIDEMEYLCDLITDMDRIEKNIWLKIFEELAPFLNLEGQNRLYFKLYLNCPNEKNKFSISKIISKKDQKYYDCLIAIAKRDLGELNISIQQKFYDFHLKFYHIIVRELINRHDKNQQFPFKMTITQNVMSAVKCCNQIIKNPWKVDYGLKPIKYKIYYAYPTFFFKTQEDMALFKLLL